MKWLIAFALLFSLPTAEFAAQEVNAATLASGSSLSAAFPAPQPQPRPQTIRDDDVQGTWELGLGYAFVRFQSSLFNASMNGLDTTFSYYLRDHLALEGNVTRPSRCGGQRDGGIRLAEFGCKVRFLWRGSESQQRQSQATAFCARPRGWCPHFSASGDRQQWICGSTRRGLGDKVATAALAANRSRLCAFATIFVGTKQFPGGCLDKLPLLASGCLAGLLRCRRAQKKSRTVNRVCLALPMRTEALGPSSSYSRVTKLDPGRRYIRMGQPHTVPR